MRKLAVCCAASLFMSLAPLGAMAQDIEDYERWEVLQSAFESTGGGGIIIKGYNPVITGDKCNTDFTATEPKGTVYYNEVEFDAVLVQGGTLCANGRWRAKDGSASGTTPFRVFFKNGVWRRSP